MYKHCVTNTILITTYLASNMAGFKVLALVLLLFSPLVMVSENRVVRRDLGGLTICGIGVSLDIGNGRGSGGNSISGLSVTSGMSSGSNMWSNSKSGSSDASFTTGLYIGSRCVGSGSRNH